MRFSSLFLLLLAAPRAAVNAVDEPVRIPAQTLGRRLADAVHYARITGSSLGWYTFPRLVERWDEMTEALARGADRPRAVRRVMAFFIAHRVLGSTGSYAPMGFRVAANRVVVSDAWRIYDAYFPKDAASRDAFSRLIARAERFNPNRRSTQFRKVIFHALREAAVLPPAELPAFFDTLATGDRAQELADYQAGEQQRVLGLFETVTDSVIRDINKALPRGRRILAAVLLGSFANGAAGPGSDLDVQTVTEDGKPGANPAFLKMLKSRWKAEGEPSNPVSGFDYVLPASKPLLTRIHREPYLVVSPYPEVKAALTADPGELNGHDTRRTLKGLAFVAAYSAVLFTVLGVYEAYRLAGRALTRG
ncbi:MAG: nucleotidyltransferase domain-containing protein [Elusimicrobia bacterium]|nr:nucleotidyltransferase domain-containing protein [Elusimicrobiota bacterium]